MNIKRSAWLVAAFAMLTVCVYGAFAPEELVVAGLYDTITKYVAEDDVDVIPANVLIDPLYGVDASIVLGLAGWIVAFNVVKGIVNSVLTGVVYKSISNLITPKKNQVKGR